MNIRTEKKEKLRKIIAGAMVLLTLAIMVLGQQSTKAASSYPYLIKVNKALNCVTIYEKDSKGNYTVPIKSMICSVGLATPSGTYKTPAKYRWKLLINDVWGQYSTRIVNGILFHSAWYYKQDPSTLSANEYNKLGTTCSHGCIRLTVADAKWIYDNCPIGTTVTIYSDSKNPGPLGKPQAIKLPAGTGWDPTDVTNPNNPFNNKKPSISGATSQNVKYGSAVDLKKGITAKSTTGYSITSDIKISGKVDTKKAGKYKITYDVTDLLGREASKSVYYTVLPDDSKPVILGVKDRLVGPKTKINRETLLKGVTAKLGDKTVSLKQVKVTIVKKNDTIYKITYRYTAPNGKTAEKTSVITVDNTPPVIKGIEDKEIPWGTTVNMKSVLAGVSAKDDHTSAKKLKVKAEIMQNDDNTYTIIYTATDELGNIAEEAVTYTITDFLKLEGVEDRMVPFGTELDDTYVKLGVIATDKDVDVSEKIEVSISELVDGQYTVTYIVRDDYGYEESATAIFTLEMAPEIKQIP